MNGSNSRERSCRQQALCWSRRQFVRAGGVGTATLLLGQIFPDRVRSEDENRAVAVTRYPGQRVARLSDLSLNRALDFEFPAGAANANAMLVKLGRRAGGGIGPQSDIVAYSTLCTHMGGELYYNAEHKLAGPCPEHLTTFDLTRHGMVVAGHATEALPQVILNMEEDDIFAVGLIGLLYGHHANPEIAQGHGEPAF